MKNYTQTDKRLHFYSQVIAKANRTYVPAKEDDSHTNLYFDSLGNRLCGRWINTKNGDVLLSLHLDTLAYVFTNRSLEILEKVPAASKTMLTIEKEIESLLPAMGLNPSGFADELHFEIPDYDFADKPLEALPAEDLQIWKKYRALGNEACLNLLGHAQMWEEIRIWPHHFDTGIYFKSKKDLGIGFGLAMEDAMAGAPYFYMAPYPEGKTLDFKSVPKGDWNWEIGKHWKGAFLSIEALDSMAMVEKKKLISQFIKTVYNWMAIQ